MTHTRKNRSKKRKVDSTISRGNSTSNASFDGVAPRPLGISGAVPFGTLERISLRVWKAEFDMNGFAIRERKYSVCAPLRGILYEVLCYAVVMEEEEMKVSTATRSGCCRSPDVERCEFRPTLFPYLVYLGQFTA
jgi:hypothetical protein